MPQDPPDDGEQRPGCEDDHGAADLEFIYFQEPVFAAPGDEGIRAGVYMETAGDLDGLTLSLRAPAQWIHLTRIDFLGTVLEELGPDWIYSFTAKAEEGYLAASVALSIGPPLRTIPDLQDALIAILEFSVDQSAPMGTMRIEFVSTPVGDKLPPIRNEISRKGKRQPFNVCGVKVHVAARETLFTRGDANRDSLVNLTDAITVLKFLFADAGTVIPCPDSGDFDDNGHIDISDAISVINYLFGGGAPPRPPFPTVGQDSEEADALGCVSSAPAL